MNKQQRIALESLGRLTETGRMGRDASSQCLYEPKGTENGEDLDVINLRVLRSL